MAGKRTPRSSRGRGGQDTLAPEEFGRKYGWKNDPRRPRLAQQAGGEEGR
jgi:hypothetical protein